MIPLHDPERQTKYVCELERAKGEKERWVQRVRFESEFRKKWSWTLNFKKLIFTLFPTYLLSVVILTSSPAALAA